MPAEDIIKRINEEAEKQARAVLDSAALESKKIIDEARKTAAEKAEQAIEEAKNEAETRKRELRLEIEAEEELVKGRAFDEVVEKEALQIASEIKKELEKKHMGELIDKAVEQISKSMGKDQIIAIAEKKYEAMLKSKGVKTETASTNANTKANANDIVLESADGKIKLHISLDDLLKRYTEQIESEVARALKAKQQVLK
ncbi:MAG: hypothetical protein ACP5MC_01850 [Candidatus Micrarchaeia archaeon]